jgi:hypothetical protein
MTCTCFSFFFPALPPTPPVFALCLAPILYTKLTKITTTLQVSSPSQPLTYPKTTSLYREQRHSTSSWKFKGKFQFFCFLIWTIHELEFNNDVFFIMVFGFYLMILPKIELSFWFNWALIEWNAIPFYVNEFVCVCVCVCVCIALCCTISVAVALEHAFSYSGWEWCVSR